MSCTGIGKTTLANEICEKWARDGFLAEDFDLVILIPLRSVQHRSTEEIMIEHIGEETYDQVKKSADSRCLLILEGWDEMAAERPVMIHFYHACEKLKQNVGRRVEVVGFSKKEIREFVEKSFPNDIQRVKEFSQQLKEYPHLESLSYVPMNLVMIVDIFECSEGKLPSTITQLFIVMTLQRQVKKENEQKKTCLTTVATNSDEKTLCKLCTMFAGVPKEAA